MIEIAQKLTRMYKLKRESKETTTQSKMLSRNVYSGLLNSHRHQNCGNCIKGQEENGTKMTETSAYDEL